MLGTGDQTEGLAYARQGLSTELQTSLTPSYFFSNAGTITATETCVLSFKLETPLMARLIEHYIAKVLLDFHYLLMFVKYDLGLGNKEKM